MISPDLSAAPDKPEYIFTGGLPAALDHLRKQRCWVVWGYVVKNGKWTKPPINPRTGRPASVSNSATWGTYDQALAGMQRFGAAGVGIVLTNDADITGIDLDDCINDAGSFSPLAAELVELGETYAEISPSGEGIRLFARGKLDKALKVDAIGVEAYASGRYLTVTGNKLDDTPDEMRPAPQTLELLKAAVERAKPDAKSNGPVPPHSGGDFFASVNAAALACLDAWVPLLHPRAKKQATGAWRIASKALGRGLQEDLSYHPEGIRDHGEEHGLTPIDAVLKYGCETDAVAAAMWLCQRIGVEPASLGWGGNGHAKAGHHQTRGQANGKAEDGRAESGGAARAEQPGTTDETSDVVPWPVLDPAAMHGLAGEIAQLAAEGSEADPLAVLVSSLVCAGAFFGRGRSLSVGDDQHHARLFATLVGDSSRARKGTSYGPVRRIFSAAEKQLHHVSTLPFPCGSSLKISHGPLSSGEGLVDAIRDRKENDEKDKGVSDKRLLCFESELGAALRACQRQGNTLSSIVRAAWDGHTLAPLTKSNKIAATDPHICILAHITRHELTQLLSISDAWNGLANRILWMVVRRTKRMPLPRPMVDADVQRLGKTLANAIRSAHERTADAAPIAMAPDASAHWQGIYDELSQDHTGMLGAVTSRAESQTLRLAMTYALLDQADAIELQHLNAAHALWRYSFASASLIFGKAELDPVAQTILDALGSGPKTQTEISALFGRHKTAAQLASVLASLQGRGRITLEEEKTPGRSRQVWRLCR